MKVLLVLIAFAILVSVCWPLALLTLVAWPIVWLISIPFVLLGMVIAAVLALFKAVLFLPARILGF